MILASSLALIPSGNGDRCLLGVWLVSANSWCRCLWGPVSSPYLFGAIMLSKCLFCSPNLRKALARQPIVAAANLILQASFLSVSICLNPLFQQFRAQCVHGCVGFRKPQYFISLSVVLILPFFVCDLCMIHA